MDKIYLRTEKKKFNISNVQSSSSLGRGA